jgi:hypothetical protein
VTTTGRDAAKAAKAKKLRTLRNAGCGAKPRSLVWIDIIGHAGTIGKSNRRHDHLA